MKTEMSKQKMLKIATVWALFILLWSANAEACTSETEIPHNQWVQYSTPCAASQRPVDVFPGDRGKDWQVFAYSPEINSYVQSDTFERGSGYWVIQYSGRTVNLVTSGPTDLPSIREIHGWQSSGIRWDLIGSMIGGGLTWDSVNILTDGDWHESGDRGVHIFRWNPELQRYDTPSNSVLLPAGSGFWITTTLPSERTGVYFGNVPASGPGSIGWL